MKNKKGFTLIELLAVIVILSILLSISVVSVNNIRKKQETENRKNVISSILTGAKRYVADHPEVLDEIYFVDVNELLENDKRIEYVDFDQNKYNDLKDSQVTIDLCINGLKLKYSFTDPADDKTYNDCGCESQTDNAPSAKKLCE